MRPFQLLPKPANVAVTSDVPPTDVLRTANFDAAQIFQSFIRHGIGITAARLAEVRSTMMCRAGSARCCECWQWRKIGR